MNSSAPDPRPLSPADPPLLPPPVRVWHFISADLEHEHWTECADEAEALYSQYGLRGTPYEVTCTLEPTH